ncbi:hypothetical protein BT93_E2472 [Corymbia citriodora subsp. variegata]|nr:hypothetical protein BT93_E2472 [Corymbia citriodora subsp. variegata]
MSKKKAFSGSTMTLKDFHGGSIPSDLPLPSAPGVTARPSDRPGFERQAPWGNPVGRPDHRTRPNSSPATRHFDDKSLFLSQTMPIGRNFDEDERKPLDGISAPRRTISDDSIRVSTRLELKPQSVTVGRVPSQQGQSQVLQLPSHPQSPYVGVAPEGAQLGISSPSAGGNNRPGVPGSSPNVWAARKEAATVGESLQSARSASNAASKLVHASALDKVSSGRWQSKPTVPYQVDVEVSKFVEEESELITRGVDDGKYRTNVVTVREHHDAALARHAERNLNIAEGILGGRKGLPDHVKVEDLVSSDGKEKNPPIYSESVRLMHTEGKIGQSRLQQPVPSEASERPKLKLFPRTKPVESSEPPSGEPNLGIVHPVKHALHGTESGNQAVERPKLNLKPRSQPIEQPEGNNERDRSLVFGGARPRELVLKERGVDDVPVNNRDLGPSSDRLKNDVPKMERASGNVIPTHYSEQSENLVIDQRNGKKLERKDQRIVEKDDAQKRNWRNENRWNGREAERQQPAHQQQQPERRPSPETWRKPVEEPPKPASPEAGVRFGKAASAVELAQAFSGSYSAQPSTPKFPGQKGIPAQPQMPFSRLTSPSSRPQINGY